MEECHHLKNEIEKLIQRGHLKEYVNHYAQGRNFDRGPNVQTPRDDNYPTARVILWPQNDQQAMKEELKVHVAKKKYFLASHL